MFISCELLTVERARYYSSVNIVVTGILSSRQDYTEEKMYSQLPRRRSTSLFCKGFKVTKVTVGRGGFNALIMGRRSVVSPVQPQEEENWFVFFGHGMMYASIVQNVAYSTPFRGDVRDFAGDSATSRWRGVSCHWVLFRCCAVSSFLESSGAIPALRSGRYMYAV